MFGGYGSFMVDGHVTVLRPRDSIADGRWIEALVRSPWGQSHLESRCFSGSTNQVETSRTQLASTRIPAPPLAEQRRIAEILDTIDGTIRSTEGLIAKLGQMKQGLLHDLLTRGIGENGALRPRADERSDLYSETVAGKVPNDWEVGLLDCFAIRGSGHTPNKNVPSFWDGGIKWVSLADSRRLDNVWIDETDKEISELGIANSSAVIHTEGTVILSRDAGVGESAIIARDMAVSQHFMAWRCGPRLNNLYLYYWMQHAKPRFEAIAMGSTIKTIGLAYFRKLEIAVPTRREQDAVATRMLDFDGLLWKSKGELNKLRFLQHGVMDDLLTGRARAKVDREVAE
jgi:type I restriction enzyme S subunit